MFATVAALLARAAEKEQPTPPTPVEKPRGRAERICRRCTTTWRTDPVHPEPCWCCGSPGVARCWPEVGFPQLVNTYTPLYPANETEL